MANAAEKKTETAGMEPEEKVIDPKKSAPAKAEPAKEAGFLQMALGFVKDWGWAALLLAAVFIIGYYTLFPSRGYFHSDTTDTLMWAVASNESGSLFNTDFDYACLLPFGTTLIMTALIPVFGVTMTTHVIGMLCFFLIFTAGLIWMLKKMDWSWGWISAAVFTVLMICSGSEKLREIFWGHSIYYSLGVQFIFIGLALLFSQMDLQGRLDSTKDAEAAKKTRIKFIIFTVLIGIWFLLTCMDQLIAITIFALPVMGGVFIERWLDRTEKPFSRRNRQAMLVFGVMGVGMVLGYLLTKSMAKDITAGYEGAYSNYSGMEKWMDNALTFPRAWLSLLGVAVNEGDKLMSVDSVKALFIVITGMLLLLIPLAALFCYRKIEDVKLRILIITHWLMVLLIMMGYILGKLSNANWRLSPIVAMSALVSIAFIRWAAGQVDLKRLMTMAMIPMMIVCTVTAVTILKMPAKNTEDNHLYRFAEQLSAKNLSYGYATFWNANGLTVASDSSVKCRAVVIDENGYRPYYYQTCRSWYNNQPGQSQYFLLMSQGERDMILNAGSPIVDRKTQEFSIDGYVVWVFNENIF